MGGIVFFEDKWWEVGDVGYLCGYNGYCDCVMFC